MPGPVLAFTSTTVSASPSGASETTVCSVVVGAETYPGQTIHLRGFINITTQSATTAVVMKIRQGSVTGTQVGTTETHTIFGGAAAVSMICHAYAEDTPSPFAGAIYVLTATCTNAAGAATVNTADFSAQVF